MTPLSPTRSVRTFAGGMAAAMLGVAILLLDLYDVAWFTWPFRLAGLVLLLAAVAVFYTGQVRDWRRIDEVAQSARKASWFWGAMIGIGLWMVLVWSPWTIDLANVLAATYANLQPERVAALSGGLMLIACMFAAYAVSLAAWWIAKR